MTNTTKTDNPLVIKHFRAENIKRLNVVDITPDGNMVIIGGQNGQGKSSTLDAIAMALGGKNLCPSMPLKQGAKSGSVELVIGERSVTVGKFTVTRTFTVDGKTALKVTTADGASFSSPQAMLDILFSSISFDPLAFSRMDNKKQAQVLRDLVGVDVTALDEKRKAIFDERTEVNREEKALYARGEKMPKHSDAPAAEVSLTEISNKLREAHTHNGTIDTRSRYVETLMESINSRTAEIKELETRLAEVRTRLAENTAKHLEYSQVLSQMEPIDTEELSAQFGNAELLNQKYRENAQYNNIVEQWQAESAKAAKLTAQLQAIDAEKEAMLKNAKFPIEGLSFGEDGILFNGIPFDQCSGAEAIRVSVAIGFATNPKAPVVRIYDGSLLDHASLEVITGMAQEAGAQVWMERVGDGKEMSVIIEDGRVQGADDVQGAEGSQMTIEDVAPEAVKTAAKKPLPISTFDAALPEMFSDENAPEWIETPMSSQINGYSYKAAAQVLTVEFKGGGRYEYYEVPTDVYEGMTIAESVGSYFGKSVKGIYQFQKMQKAA